MNEDDRIRGVTNEALNHKLDVMLELLRGVPEISDCLGRVEAMSGT